MIDIVAYMKSLKLSWLKRLLSGNNSNICLFVQQIFNIDMIINCGKMYIDKICGKIKNIFWKDVLYAYSNIIEVSTIESTNDFLNLPLFYNHNILIDNRPVFYKSWYDKGIRYINDLMTKNGNFIKEQI